MKAKLDFIWKKYFQKNPALPWVFLFLFISLFVTQYGGTNARARIASLRAITENGSLHIDAYRDWTVDWALSPNGHYYSNKPPGALFIGLPIFALTEIPERILQNGKKDAYGRQHEPSYWQHLVLILCTQLLPFSFLILIITRFLASQGIPLAAQHFFVLAALMGNTAAIYMNCYFGHGLSALLFLAAFYCWHGKKWLLSGFFLSWCMLNDYGTIFVLPAFLFATIWRERNLKFLPTALLGAAPAALLWCWYHTVSFGSPLALASHFTNPEQMYQVPERANLWGTYSIFPHPDFLWRLLFSSERGLLHTQPWLLFAIPFFLFLKDRVLFSGACLLFGGLAGLLWMNAGFGGWHGGWALGPRYPSLIFPAFALMIALMWNHLPRIAHYILWSSLLVSLLFRWLVLPFPNIAPLVPLWSFHIEKIRNASSLTPILRLSLAGIAAALALIWALRGISIRKAIGLSSKAV
jgi:hypothetical protein